MNFDAARNNLDGAVQIFGGHIHRTWMSLAACYLTMTREGQGEPRRGNFSQKISVSHT